ncbi:MAG: hypothetical protein M3112_09060 [Actinomycetia bacterium]|nr:hypothetical protein [Actinomycetes bacterium]
MEDLINDIQEKTGLSTDKVLEVVTMVADYMKQALPDDLVAQITAYLGDAASSPGDAAGDVIASAADVAASAAGSTASAVTSVIDAIGDMMPTPDAE